MNLELKNKTALITGSSQGIGKAIALALAKEGCNIILCSRNIEKLAIVAKEIESLKTAGRVYYDCVDGTKSTSVGQFFKVLNPKRNLDILVNNIGGGTERSRDFFNLEDEDWLNLYNLNLVSMVRFTRSSLPLLLKSKSGRIINIGTVSARQPGKFNPHYSAAKAAMMYLNKYLASELAPKGICVNMLCPHSLMGESWERDILDRSERLKIPAGEAREMMTKEVLQKIPIGRQGVHEDIATLAAFLASPMANFITGACISVDGGTIRSIF